MCSKGDVVFNYDESRWREVPVSPVNTLQLFITNRCNLRCRGCFYAQGLGRDRMSLETYRAHLDEYAGQYSKVILLGGEPLLHPELGDLLEENERRGLRTTIYTNGRNLPDLPAARYSKVELRVGVYGVSSSEKALDRVTDTDWPVKIVYMLRRDNIAELMPAAKEAERRFDCRGFYISSIRDTVATGDYWKDTDDTVSPHEFAEIAQRFVDEYDGGLTRLDIATRGVLVTRSQDFRATRHCRFGNIFPDGQKIACPFDIAGRRFEPGLTFGSRPCNKHNRCLLQKIVLVRA